MKNIIKTVIALMTLTLVVLAFAGCDFNLPTECEHSWTDATCTSPKTCSVCKVTEGEALGHTEEILVGKDATCTEAGLTDGKKCSTCGETLVAQEEIPALGHTEEILKGEEPTCTSTGLTEGKKCSVCYVVLVAQEEIPMADHTEEVVAGKASTCTETGLTDGKKCSVCGVITLAQEEIPMADHTEEVVEGKAPTCTETGLTDGKRCSVCEAVLVEQEVIEADGHKDENKDFECDVCHIDLCVDHIPADAVEENRVEATCTAEGSYELVVKCSNCGEEISREAKVIAKLDHTEETIEGKDATCTETGLTAGKKCSVCGTVLAEQTEIPAGHNIVDGVCTVCGFIPNVFAGKTPAAASDAAGNIYSASFGYNKMTDGDLASRYSSKKNGGKVEAIIDLGAVYDLNEFRILLYDYPASKFAQFGTGVEIYVLFGGEWKQVINATVEEFNVVITGDQNWLTFDLGGVAGRQVKFVIPSHGTAGWSTFWEIQCSAKVSEQVEPEPEEPVFVENIFAGKQFVPTSDALANVLAASWWKGGGYETLTDGIKNADNAPGRFSTVMKATGMMDATIELGGEYELHSLKFYTYDPAAGTGAGSLGASLLIQVYADGEWKDVLVCADNATLASYLVVNEGTYNDYLEFDLGGIKAEKVRIYISASASASGTTYEEIECNGYAK